MYLSPVEIVFLEEYARTMSPITKALKILQAEIEVQMGRLLPTLTLLISTWPNSHFFQVLQISGGCQEGLQQRFGNMLVDPEFIAAAILVPKFKTSWTSDEHIVKLDKIILVLFLKSVVSYSYRETESGYF